jgi:transcriptional regulator with XRE-family HTH domain
VTTDPHGTAQQGMDRPEPATDLAAKLNRLFGLHRRPDGRRYTLRDVSKAVSDDGIPLSASYLSQLVTGRRENPSGAVLRGLARFFATDVSYFLGEPAQVELIEANLALQQVVRDRRVRDIAVRAAQLSPTSLRALAAFIDHLESSTPPSRARRSPL